MIAKQNNVVKEVQHLAKSGVMTLTGLVFTNIASLAFGVMLGRVLGPEQYGLYSIGFVVFNLVGSIAIFGMGQAALRFIPPATAQAGLGAAKFILLRIMTLSFVIAIAISMGLFSASDYLSREIFEEQKLTSIIRLFSLCIPLFVITFLGATGLQALRRVRCQVMARNFIEPGVKVVGVVGFIVMHVVSPEGAIAILMVALLCSAGYSFYHLYKLFHNVQAERPLAWSCKSLLAFALPLFLNLLLNTALSQIYILFLGKYASLQDVGIYSATLLISNIAIVILTAANQVFSPMVSEIFHLNQLDLLSTLYKTMVRWIMIGSLPIFSVLVLYPSQILDVFGSRYIEGAPALMILTFGYVVRNIAGVSNTILVMAGRTHTELLNSMATVVFSLTACWLLIPSNGILGAALSFSLTLTLLSFLLVMQVKHLLNLSPFDKSLWKPVFAATLTIIIFKCLAFFNISPAGWLGIFWAGPLVLVTYAGLLCLVGWETHDRLFAKEIKEMMSTRFMPFRVKKIRALVLEKAEKAITE